MVVTPAVRSCVRQLWVLEWGLVKPAVRCVTTRRGHVRQATLRRKLSFESCLFVWWSHYFLILRAVCMNAMFSSVPNTSEVTTTGGETVPTGCKELKPHSRTRRDCSCITRNLIWYHSTLINGKMGNKKLDYRFCRIISKALHKSELLKG